MKGMKNMKENPIVRFSALSKRVIGCALVRRGDQTR